MDVVMPPAAIKLIHKNAEHLTPVTMVAMVQEAYSIVMAMQVYKVWVAMTQTFWQWDNLQIPSACKLLRELRDYVNVLNPSMLPDGVEMLCWGMTKIAQRLMGKVVEISIDATYNTNSKHLELYSMMGEYDNAGSRCKDARRAWESYNGNLNVCAAPPGYPQGIVHRDVQGLVQPAWVMSKGASR
ncbi:hypothetical protein BDQ17DRAFT_1437354 [Cyathus striatus]|nr:hypothetical protein BDQ17DRAFT_1437354 [Cyathus striatus]